VTEIPKPRAAGKAHHYTTQEKRLTVIALMVVLLLGALDQNIVATALPRIIEHLHGIELYSWVGTSYMLTSTVMVPIYGKLSDIYGRKRILIIGVSIFLLGSMLCGLSGEFGRLPLLGDGMPQLIVFRAIQGIGGGALFSSAFTVIAEIFPPRERGRYMGLFGGCMALASIAGPAIGGFFTDFADTSLFSYQIAGWRWVFYVNLPIGIAALTLIVLRMPRLAHHEGVRVDVLGAVLVVMTFVPLLLALTWGGQSHPWGSPLIGALLLLTIGSLVAFVFVERRTADAIVPLELFRVRAFSLTNAASFVLGVSFFGVVMFMPLFLQAVTRVSATQSGFAMLPLMAGMLTGSIGSGNLVTRTGRYRLLLVFGGMSLFSGVLLLSLIGPESPLLDIGWRMALVGLGLGPTYSILTLVSQAAVDQRHLGVATSAVQFSRQIGATIGIALVGALVTANLTRELTERLPSMPGVVAERIDLGEAQERAMHPEVLAVQVRQQLLALKPLIESAYRGDATARAQLLQDELLPQEFRQQLRDNATSPDRSVMAEQLAALDERLDRIIATATQHADRQLRLAFSDAITEALRWMLIVVLLGAGLSIMVPQLPLGQHHDEPAASH